MHGCKPNLRVKTLYKGWHFVSLYKPKKGSSVKCIDDVLPVDEGCSENQSLLHKLSKPVALSIEAYSVFA